MQNCAELMWPSVCVQREEPLIHHESARALGKYPQDVNMRRTDTWAFSEVAGVKPLLCWASREDMESEGACHIPASSLQHRLQSCGRVGRELLLQNGQPCLCDRICPIGLLQR